MRILVIGGNGFIGRPLVREFIESGHDVGVFHRSTGSGSGPQAVHTAAVTGEATQIRGDRNRLRDHEAELQRFAPEVIVDMVLSSGEQAEQLVDVARDLNARAVAISSMDVYRAWGVMQGSEPGELEPTPLTEKSPVRTVRRAYPPEMVQKMKSIFTWLNADYDKIAVEQAVMGGKARGTVVRLPMVYGPGDPLHRMHGVLKRIKDGRAAIILAADHAAWRGPRGYVENVAHAIGLASVSEQAAGRIYNICEEPSLTELEWQSEIARHTEWRGKFVLLSHQQTPQHLLLPGNAAQEIVASSERIRKELGYSEPVTLDEAVRRTIVWGEENPPGGTGFHQFDYAVEDAALAQVQLG